MSSEASFSSGNPKLVIRKGATLEQSYHLKYHSPASIRNYQARLDRHFTHKVSCSVLWGKSKNKRKKRKGIKQNTQMFSCSHDDLRVRCFFVHSWNKKSTNNLERKKMWKNRKQSQQIVSQAFQVI